MMWIAVGERTSEIGLVRALGRHPRTGAGPLPRRGGGARDARRHRRHRPRPRPRRRAALLRAGAAGRDAGAVRASPASPRASSPGSSPASPPRGARPPSTPSRPCVPSRPRTAAPLLRFTLADGRPATLLLGDASTVLSIDDTLVSSWDLAGRPYALVRETGTYRRGLDGGLLWKREATAEGPRLRRRLSAAGRRARRRSRPPDADAALEGLSVRGWLPDGPSGGIRSGARPFADCRRSSPWTPRALRDDAARFLAASGPVGILPPDQYLALVVRVTEGCSWNACTFCRLYRDVPFRWKRPDELDAHLAALRAYFGPSIALRRSVFLGDANALCLAHDRLLPLVERRGRALPGSPLYSFLDAWTGQRRTAGRVARLRRPRPEERLRGPRDRRPRAPRLAREARLAAGRRGPRRRAPRGRHRRGGDRPPRRRGRALRRGPRGAHRRGPHRDASSARTTSSTSPSTWTTPASPTGDAPPEPRTCGPSPRTAAPNSAARSSTASGERQAPVRRATRPTTSASLCIDASAGPAR